MNINYIDCLLFLLLLFICLILYDSHKIISFIKKNTLHYTNYIENFLINKQNNTIKLKQEQNLFPIKPEQEQNNIIKLKQEHDNIIKSEQKQDNIIKEDNEDIEKELFYYLTHPKPYNENNVSEDTDIDPAEKYLDTYNPKPLEIENKVIRGHNFNELDTFPKINQFGGDIPLKNNEFSYAMADGYIFKDSASL